ncbi:glycosyltransferase family 25 protein [Apibacter muscae]|uniref:Glycosyltransferase family 25 protein n=1 Tax=Apibacter muscae TaxID=2509004 RepID=A0A563DC96_9FLAO|nr:glycosyltransferase family 25 protein [Apibacter muscae]TWP24086.1 glycosyltransferase family 25 protein [Apibacter muscae]TWP27717.1 glycosyltransferase family 25 protein [Apibacter muscae]TWP29537.1 glycosyltransferase family 25 protein [Apibacter muscae]
MNSPFNLYETYLINLNRSKDRLNFMESEFKKQKMNFLRIPAVDGSLLKGDEYIIKNKYDRDLVPGEIGCYLSHVKALKTFLVSKYEYALIIEDDAILCTDFKNIIENSILNHKNNLSKKHQWEILKLINGKRHHIKITDIYKGYFLAACGTSIPITTLAAIWTRNGARKFLKKIMNPIPVIRRPIDCDLQHPWEFNLLIYNLLPSPVKGAELGTQIQLNKKLRKSNVPKEILYEINRFFPKYHYLISQHGWKSVYNSFIAKKNERIR